MTSVVVGPLFLESLSSSVKPFSEASRCRLLTMEKEGCEQCVLFFPRKSTSWHTALRLRKKSEKKEKDGKRDGKLENGYRKPREGLSHKVSVKVRVESQAWCHLQEEGGEAEPRWALSWGLLEDTLPSPGGSITLALCAFIGNCAGM